MPACSTHTEERGHGGAGAPTWSDAEGLDKGSADRIIHHAGS